MKDNVPELSNQKTEAQSYAAWIGLDWADQKHYWSMRTADGKLQRGELNNTPEAIAVWASELAERFPGRLLAVAIEQARGAVINMLSKYAHLVLLPVHSTMVANYRRNFSPSGAKSDPKDSDIILDLLIKHPEWLKPLRPDTVETRSLQFLTEERRKLVDQHTSQVQNLTSWLKQVFPQILRWFDNVSTPLVEALLLRWPTLQQLKKVSRKKLLQFLHQHNCRSEERNQQRLDEIGQAVAVTDDPAVLEAGIISIQNSVRILAGMRTGIAALDQKIAQVYNNHPDRVIVESFPAAGAALEPRLIAAIGTQRDRFQSATELASFTGIAPVTDSSGKSCWVHWRWACPKFIRQTFHEWAGCSIKHCEWAKAFYDKQRDAGKGHHAAIRALAFKWIRIFFRCWRDRVPYDEQRYLKSLELRQPKGQSSPTCQSAPAKPELVFKTCGNFKKLEAVLGLTD